ncbi:MAG TPA: efflux RND transporter periplasmic adaptor subunit, partial [Planctomycetaceae bacterium]|nr:efflux RND transporter periplasmic adaptor subunit [Planctomycetaceae bacterium]
TLAIICQWLLAVTVSAQPPASPVVVARVEQRSVADGQSFVGTVMPAKTSSVGSAVDGRVVQYPIDVGLRVAKGQALCQLLTETINLQISAAEAEQRLRAEELRELQNGSRPEEIAQSQARLETVKATHEFTEARFKRAMQLAKQGQTITQEQLDEYRSAAIGAERAVHSAEQEHKLLVQGPREEKIAQAKAKLEAQAEAVQLLKDQLKKHAMIAPFDGYVVAKRTEVGEWVSRSQIVAEIVYLDDVEIEAHVLDSQIDYVRLGMEVRVEIPALNPPLYLGKVVRISPQADVKSRTFPVKIGVPNAIRDDGPVLKAGMLARATLPVGRPHDALLIPKDAIVFGGPVPMVYALTPKPPETAPAAKGKSAAAPERAAPANGDVVRPVPVQLGVAVGNWLEVQADLKAGDRVVVLGNERLRPGAAVTVIREQPLSTEAAETDTTTSAERPSPR